LGNEYVDLPRGRVALQQRSLHSRLVSRNGCVKLPRVYNL
jgi:hypothetical protein